MNYLKDRCYRAKSVTFLLSKLNRGQMKQIKSKRLKVPSNTAKIQVSQWPGL